MCACTQGFSCMEAYVSHVDLFCRPSLKSTALVIEITKPSCSFYEVFLNKAPIPLPLPPISCAPQQKDAYVSIKVNQVAFQERLNLCKYSLIGRVILGKGNKLYPLVDLCSKQSAIWKINCWRLISLGKGYFQILLTSEEEKAKVWSMGSLHLKPRILRLLPWVLDFNSNEQKNTNVQVQVRFYDLPWAY